MSKFIDLTGQRFGRLVVIRENGRSKNKKVLWLCQCDCGNQCTVPGDRLKRGDTKSCGCYRRENTGKMFQKYADNEVNPRIYRIWKLIHQRCQGKNSPKFNNYGGRGISICTEWLDDFIAFQTWALANGYDDSLSIDRIDVNGPYSPENCRWTNNLIQCNNKTDNVFLEFCGERHSVADWARIKGIPVHTLYTRLRLGWSIKDVLETEPAIKFRHK